jgi:pSer/pThr/pTyr-binding forkhead associated (FHA) protein
MPAGEATQVIGGPAAPIGGGFGEATQHALVTPCPVCRTPNPPTERYCQDCGLLFGSAAAEIEPVPDVSQLPRLVDAGGREHPLNTGANSVGRDAADILIPDPTVSRRHAQVTLEEGLVTVEDQGSTNGTYVGGRKLAPGERAGAFAGDEVRFGSVVLSLVLPGGAARPAEGPAEASAVPPTDRGAAVAVLALDDGTEFPLYPGVNSIGRRSGNQVVLADAFMSGRHAEITCNEDGSAQLVDVGSTNGTFVGADRLAANVPLALTEGTVVRLGKTPVTFHATAAPEASADTLNTAAVAPEPTMVGGFVLPEPTLMSPPPDATSS